MFTWKNRKFITILVLTAALVLAITSIATAAVWTDKPDYSPGETVTISGDNSDGAGYLPGETVHVDVSGPNGYTSYCDATADGSGAWSCQVTLNGDMSAVGDYSYTATSASGVNQSGTFTDGNATISGTVKDSSNNPIEGATVACTSGCNASASTTSDSNGNYSFKPSFAGSGCTTLGLTTSMRGFNSQSIDKAVCHTSPPSTYQVNFILSVSCTNASVTTNPSNKTVYYGSDATFTAEANGNPAPTVQWQVGTGLPVSWSNLTDETGTTLTLTSPAVSMSGNQYRAVFTNNCEGTQTATTSAAMLTVSKKTASVSAVANSKTYGEPDPALATTNSGFLTGDLGAGKITFNASRVAGETVAGSPYLITPSADDNGTGLLNNYDITYNTANFTISRREATWTTNPNSKTYGDADPDPLTTGSGSNFVDTDDVTATYSRVAGETVAGGPYHISATLAPAGVLGNYNITNNGADFTINKRDATWTTNPNSKTYGDADPDPITTGSGSNFVDTDGVTATYSRVAGETVAGGPYHISATLAPVAVLGNYNITNNGADFTINKRDATWTTNPNSKTYGDADPDPLTTGSGSNFVDTDGVTATYSRVAGETVAGGPYHISATLAPAGVLGNYNITNNGADFTINPKTITVTAVAKSKILNAPDPALTYTYTPALVENDSFSGALTRVPGESVGTYAILQGTLKLSSNYTLIYVGANFSITFAPAGMCYGGPGHVILPPINEDKSSVWKRGNTVPVKFRVCDANGVSIGGDISSVFDLNGKIAVPYLISTTYGSGQIDEVAVSNIPDPYFRWSGDQWIFNLNTNNLVRGYTYQYRIYLKDGSSIDFWFGLK